MASSLMGPLASCAVGIALLAGGCRCESHASDPVDGWEMARAEILSGKGCYERRPEYCLRDPEFVDAVIRAALNGQPMPTTRREAEKLARDAAHQYRQAVVEDPARVAQVERLVREHFDASPIELGSNYATSDLGVPPGKLRVDGQFLAYTSSDVIERGELKTSVLGKALRRVAELHPDKNVARIELTIPGRLNKKLVYRYYRDENRIVFNESSFVRVSEPLAGGLAALERGAEGGFEMRNCDTPGTVRGKRIEGFCPKEDVVKRR